MQVVFSLMRSKVVKKKKTTKKKHLSVHNRQEKRYCLLFFAFLSAELNNIARDTSTGLCCCYSEAFSATTSPVRCHSRARRCDLSSDLR